MTERERSETVLYVSQASLADSAEWGPWADMIGPGSGSDDLYAAIHKVELYHYFMQHGAYPEPFHSTAEAATFLPLMRAARNAIVAARKSDGIKIRTRIVKRTVLLVVTDEEVDRPVIIKHGDPT